MRPIIDENMPDALIYLFDERGHNVESVRALYGQGMDDPTIAHFGNYEAGIVVTADKDFRRLIERAPIGKRAQFRRLGRISLDCRSGSVVRRMEALMHVIEFGYADALASRDRRLIDEISETSIRFVR